MSQGITLRQAGLTAGFALLLMGTVPFAELYVYPKLVVAGNVEATVRNIAANRGLFVAGALCYTNSFVADVIVAWALYILLAPVDRALSLLAAWFRLVYAAIALVAVFKLLTVSRLLAAASGDAFDPDRLHAQVQLLLSSFRSEWSMGLLLFGIHLVLVGYLVYRSHYIPRILGILLAIAGAGWAINALGPHLLPGVDLGFAMITGLGELFFMLWLLIRGWRLPNTVALAEGR